MSYEVQSLTISSFSSLTAIDVNLSYEIRETNKKELHIVIGILDGRDYASGPRNGKVRMELEVGDEECLV